MLWIVNVGTSSMLGRFCISITKPMLLVVPYFDDAIFATSSATIFWLLGVCTNSILSNSSVRCFVSLRYFYILSSFASYSSLICLITSFESFWTNRFLALSAFPSLSPVNISLYSTSLLVAENFSWTSYLSTSSLRVVMTTLTPPFYWANEPSVCTIHCSSSFVRLPSSGRVNSAMKSARAYALMAILGWYSMSNWLSSIAY